MTWISVQDVSKLKDSYVNENKRKVKVINRYQTIGAIQKSIQINNNNNTNERYISILNFCLLCIKNSETYSPDDTTKNAIIVSKKNIITKANSPFIFKYHTTFFNHGKLNLKRN
jgi:hypothetical protein